MERLPHIAPLADRFDDFIIDLWGVVHDGQHPYPGVVETLELLRKRNKKVLFLSNAPRRARKAVEVLDRLGISRGLYDHILTSGEVTHHHLARSGRTLGQSYLYIGPEKDAGLAEGLDYHMVEHAEKADFALVTGFDADDSTLEEKRGQIEACLAAKLPLICANPDLEVVRQDGTRMLCAGVIARHYEAHGGKVRYFGKPYPDVYKECLDFFGTRDVSRICAIGDALETDVKGAKAQGIFAVLCTGGILAQRLKTVSGKLPEQPALDSLCAEEKVTPDAVIPAFVW